MEKKNCDIAIIGSGPGGYSAAIKASQAAKKVIIIEKGNLGGVCLNAGCIPTKIMLEASCRLSALNEVSKLGIHATDVSFNFKELIDYRDKFVKKLVKGLEFLLKANNIEVVKGHARLLNANSLQVDENFLIESENIIIAAGSKALQPQIQGASDGILLDSASMLNINEIPERLLVIGAGAIGLEFGWMFKKLGSSVTIVEKMPAILPKEDTELTERLQALLEKDGISIFTDSYAEKINKDTAVIKCPEGSKEAGFDKILVAVGRRANTQDMGLDKLGLKFSKEGNIAVDSSLKTSISNIYAIGDCIGGYQLAQAAYLEAEVAVGNIISKKEGINYHSLPRCVYTHPEVASVGLTQDEAAKDYDIKIGKFPFSANARANMVFDTGGFAKVICDKKTGAILGAHILGPSATELIHEMALAIRNNLTTNDVIGLAHAHPSFSEALKEALLNADKKAAYIKN